MQNQAKTMMEPVDLFRRLERGITLMTGLRPRDDGGRCEQRHGRAQ